MASGATVARSIRYFADQTLSPAARSAYLAKRAIEARNDLVRRGDASPVWQTFVDGRQGVPETAVRPDGAILYKFNIVALAATFALAFVKSRSPVRSGAYRNGWIIVVSGRVFRDDLNDIPNSAEVMIVNPLPYARKIDTGAMKMSVPPGIVEGARQATKGKFPSMSVERAFVNIPAGLLPGAPYVLKAFKRRRDRTAGQELTYPALVLSSRLQTSK